MFKIPRIGLAREKVWSASVGEPGERKEVLRKFPTGRSRGKTLVCRGKTMAQARARRRRPLLFLSSTGRGALESFGMRDAGGRECPSSDAQKISTTTRGRRFLSASEGEEGH